MAAEVRRPRASSGNPLPWTATVASGITSLGWTVTFAVCAAVSFTLLSIGLRTLPVGTAYAVWTGIGAAGTAVVGMLFLRDPVTTVRLLSILLIIAGVVGLNLSSSSAH